MFVNQNPVIETAGLFQIGISSLKRLWNVTNQNNYQFICDIVQLLTEMKDPTRHPAFNWLIKFKILYVYKKI